MGSYLAWLAFSEAERRRALDLIQSFEDRDTRDELGIGTIRDALADLFFPGISTIQTRARYFLFIPWIYSKLERKEVPSAEIASAGREMELKLIDALCKTLGENEGIIGYRAKKSLKRLPSDIYWQGLGVWGIRQFNGSRDAYHRYLDQYYMAAGAKLTSEEMAADISVRMHNWHSLPPAPVKFPQGVDFQLTAQEAEYLSMRILEGPRTRNSLLATLVSRRHIWEPEVQFPWLGAVFQSATLEQQQQLKHAETFSLLMLGAALLYNLILSRLRDANSQTNKNQQETNVDYQSRLQDWSKDIDEGRPLLKGWDRAAFWALVDKDASDKRTKEFCEQWFDIAMNCNFHNELIHRNSQAYRLIVDREKTLKGALSRITNQQALQHWGGESGSYRLSFRWRKARVIIRDIIGGLKR